MNYNDNTDTTVKNDVDNVELSNPFNVEFPESIAESNQFNSFGESLTDDEIEDSLSKYYSKKNTQKTIEYNGQTFDAISANGTELISIVEGEESDGITNVTYTLKGDYLPEELGVPVGVLMDKGKTGCGGTHTILNRNAKDVILVPTISVMQSKGYIAGLNVINGKRVLCVYGSIKVSQLRSAIYGGVDKIFSTYDGIVKIVKIITPSEWNLIIDEFHTFINCVTYRQKAYHSVIDNMGDFGSVTAFTATMPKREIIPSQFKSLPVVRVKWVEDKIKVQLSYVRSNIKAVASKIESNLSNNIRTIVFINNISSIIKLKDTFGDKKIGVIVSDSVTNRNLGLESINPKESANYDIILSTKKGFESADFYVDNTEFIAVMDGKAKKTFVDCDDLIQIYGRDRRRNLAYKNGNVYSLLVNGISKNVSQIPVPNIKDIMSECYVNGLCDINAVVIEYYKQCVKYNLSSRKKLEEVLRSVFDVEEVRVKEAKSVSKKTYFKECFEHFLTIENEEERILFCQNSKDNVIKLFSAFPIDVLRRTKGVKKTILSEVKNLTERPDLNLFVSAYFTVGTTYTIEKVKEIERIFNEVFNTNLITAKDLVRYKGVMTKINGKNQRAISILGYVHNGESIRNEYEVKAKTIEQSPFYNTPMFRKAERKGVKGVKNTKKLLSIKELEKYGKECTDKMMSFKYTAFDKDEMTEKVFPTTVNAVIVDCDESLCTAQIFSSLYKYGFYAQKTFSGNHSRFIIPLDKSITIASKEENTAFKGAVSMMFEQSDPHCPTYVFLSNNDFEWYDGLTLSSDNIMSYMSKYKELMSLSFVERPTVNTEVCLSKVNDTISYYLNSAVKGVRDIYAFKAASIAVRNRVDVDKLVCDDAYMRELFMKKIERLRMAV